MTEPNAIPAHWLNALNIDACRNTMRHWQGMERLRPYLPDECIDDYHALHARMRDTLTALAAAEGFDAAVTVVRLLKP